MSIAISAVIRPSRLILFSMLVMGLGTFSFGILVGTGWIGNFSIHGRLVIAFVCIGSALFSIFHHFRTRKTLRIDISGIGQIRLLEYTEVARSFAMWQRVTEKSEEEYQMMEGSTLWPNLLFLRLKSSDGRVEKISILPDSVMPDEFRALSIAFCWIAARKNTEATDLS